MDSPEEPLRDRSGFPEKGTEAQAINPSVSFSAEDCTVFTRYPNSVSWKDVTQADQETFKNIWGKLKTLSQRLAENPEAPIPLKADTSHYVPNGRSPGEIWCCVYPLAISNKSYGLQIALIISERGAEVCFCQGSGTSQIADSARKRELESGFETMRKRLGDLPPGLIASVDASQNRKWCYRKSWLTKPNETEFSSLADWLKYASSAEGSAASISAYLNPNELQALGPEIFSVFTDALKTFGPILSAVYLNPSVSRHWIFQGRPDQFDVNSYLQGRREIVWTVRQHKERILVGDRVLIWRSGAQGGVIAECTVVAQPSREILEDAAELWKQPPQSQTGELRCKLRVTDSFADAPIPRTTIRNALPDLSIIKAPQGTNFEITQADYAEIMRLKDVGNVILPFDASALLAVSTAIEATHMRIERDFLNRFVTSLLAKPFLILTGNSGTGKTKLAELFAEWLFRNDRNYFALIPVGADWTDNRSVLGYVNHLRLTKIGEASTQTEVPIFQSTKILDLLMAASNDPCRPYFLILDEMNLSHVERYFADFLSALESKDGYLLLHREGRLLPRKDGGSCDVPETMSLPRNVFFIGTVNVDETTYMFSPKVLDRANVIEFRVGSDAPLKFLSSGGKSIAQIDQAAAGYAEGFLDLSFRARSIDGEALTLAANLDALRNDAKQGIESCRGIIAELFTLMQKRHQEFAFRSMTEILRFLAVSYELKPTSGDWDWKAAMDAQILQKILPKLHGSKRKIGSLLAALAKYCERGILADAEVLLIDETKAEAYLGTDGGRENAPTFKQSYIKLCEMISAVRRDQFVSFIQ
jgi:hypothetical protein